MSRQIAQNSWAIGEERERERRDGVLASGCAFSLLLVAPPGRHSLSVPAPQPQTNGRASPSRAAVPQVRAATSGRFPAQMDARAVAQAAIIRFPLRWSGRDAATEILRWKAAWTGAYAARGHRTRFLSAECVVCVLAALLHSSQSPSISSLIMG